MASLFRGPKMPDAPKPTRMPSQMDPEILAAGQRTRAEALRRKGRLSTILTDILRDTSGGGMPSSGVALGA